MTLIAALCLGPAYLIDKYPRAVPSLSLAALGILAAGHLLAGWGR